MRRLQRSPLEIVPAAAELWDGEQEVGFLARVFTQTSLPYRDPGGRFVGWVGDAREWRGNCHGGCRWHAAWREDGDGAARWNTFEGGSGKGHPTRKAALAALLEQIVLASAAR
ncbi:hypothetical protein [Nocardia sp. NPDC050793]|uniref:hypothetical protein n=1 Tax=Nocardia sp. NPDC050793 TaxID=3155159 RepID=UPI0033F3335D